MTWILPVINTIAVLITSGVLIYYIICEYIWRRARRLMPQLAYHDFRYPLVGHLLYFLKQCATPTHMWYNVGETCEYYQESFLGQVGHQIWMFISDPRDLEDVLSSPDAVEKSYVYRTLGVITDGVFIATGLRWRKLRKRLNLTFSQRQIDSYYEPTNDKVGIMTNIVVKKLAQSNKYEDIQPYVARCFFDIMTKTHFGTDSKEQLDDEYKVPESASHVIDELITKRLLFPHLHSDFIYQYSSLCKHIEKFKVRPTAFVTQMVADRMKVYEENKNNNIASKDDILVFCDLVVDALKELNIEVTPYNLHRNSTDLLIAGSDTTSIAGACLLYHIASEREIQEKCYEEISRVFGNETNKQLTKQDLADMPYLEMCLNEALRVSSPPGIVRGLINDLPTRRFTIPVHANLYMCMAYTHHRPHFYEKPDEFYPEHFTKEAIKERPKIAFLPFSYGPRNCPGKAFAYVLIKTMAANLINNYIMETNLKKTDVTNKLILMTQHVQGYPIRFTPRHNIHPRG